MPEAPFEDVNIFSSPPVEVGKTYLKLNRVRTRLLRILLDGAIYGADDWIWVQEEREELDGMFRELGKRGPE